MQFVRNSYSFNEIPEPWEHDEILQYIEKIGRLCYRSEDKITPESAPKFIQTLKNNGHWAMLEHYIFTLSVPYEIYQSIMSPTNFTVENSDYIEKFAFIRTTKWTDAKDPELRYLVSGSATSFNNLWKCNCVKNNRYHGIHQICEFLRSLISELMCDPLQRTSSDDPEYWDERFDRQIALVSRQCVRQLPANLRRIHDWFSVHFVIERSSTHDLARHRAMVSFGQESTRYCNYDKKGLCFIIPVQFSENDKHILENPSKVDYVLAHPNDVCYGMTKMAKHWLQMVKQASDNYVELLQEFNMSPQEAKSVLPHCLRAEMNITTFKGEWHHIFNMRADSHAFPQIQEVMYPLLNEAIRDDYTVFGDLEYKLKDGAKYVN